MINRILIELYDSYVQTNNLDEIKSFAKKTFSDKNVQNLFIGCVLILFSRAGCYKPRYDVDREKLYDIVLSAKEYSGNKNLLLVYVNKINTTKGIVKYFKNFNDNNITEYAKIILDYLEQFKPKFLSDLRIKVDKKFKSK